MALAPRVDGVVAADLAKPEFKKTHAPKAPANEQTLTADGATVNMRQLDGKWYVCKGPI